MSENTEDQNSELSKEQIDKLRWEAKRKAAAFGEITSLMVQASAFQNMAIKDLSWLVAPAVASGQFAIAEAVNKETGSAMSVAAVMWATVSDEIDKKLSAETDMLVELSPEDWTSGDIPWVVCAIGEQSSVTALLQNLAESAFTAEKPARIRGRDKDGKTVVGHMRLKASDTEKEAANDR